MKTLSFSLIGNTDGWYEGCIDSFDAELTDGQAALIEELAAGSDGPVTEEDIADRDSELAGHLSSLAWDAFKDELLLEAWNEFGYDILGDYDPDEDDSGEAFDEDELDDLMGSDPYAAAEYLRSYGAEVEMVDVECTFSYGS